MTIQENRFNDLNKKFGIQMKQIRKDKKLTLKQLSAFLEITPQQLQKYEANKTQIPFSKLYLFIEVLKLKPDDFFDIKK